MMYGEPRRRRRQALFAQIRKAGSVARVDLASRTDISPSTVTTITAELLRKGLIEEVTPQGSGAGSGGGAGAAQCGRGGRADAAGSSHDTATSRPALRTATSPATGPAARPGPVLGTVAVAGPATGPAGRGRPRVALRLRPGAHHVVGLKLGYRTVSAVLCDFSNTVLAEGEVRTPRDRLGTEELLAATAHLVADLCRRADLRPSDLSGLALGLPGIVDAAGGRVRWSPALVEADLPLRDRLAARLGLPVFIDNDANLVAVCEQYYGAGRDRSDFLVVTIEQGLGLGIVIGDRVQRGARGHAAEFGHMMIDPAGPRCRCGRRGCLEAYVAGYAILDAARDLALPPCRDAGVGPGGDRSEARLAAVVAAARAGEPGAARIIDRAETRFAIAVANLVTLFDPALIVMSGERLKFDFLVTGPVLARIADYLPPAAGGPPEIAIHTWGAMMWARGAAAYAIDGIAARAIDEIDRDAA